MGAGWWRQNTPRSPNPRRSCIKLAFAVIRKESARGGESVKRGDITHRDAAKSNRRELAPKEG